jgi:hypothetical protein
MRPKKRILIASVDEQRGAILRYMLKIAGYAVHVAPTAAEAMQRLESEWCELLIVDLPFAGVDGLLDWTDTFGWRPANIGLFKSTDRPEPGAFDATLPREYSAAELRERVKFLGARKRGPKPMKKPVASAPAIAAGDHAVNF